MCAIVRVCEGMRVSGMMRVSACASGCLNIGTPQRKQEIKI